MKVVAKPFMYRDFYGGRFRKKIKKEKKVLLNIIPPQLCIFIYLNGIIQILKKNFTNHIEESIC